MRFRPIVVASVLLVSAAAALAGYGAATSPAANLQQHARMIPIPTHPWRAAKLLRRVDPKYPPEAKAKGIQGTVCLHVLIGKDGHVKKLRVISGPRILVKAAENAVRQWVYEPALLNGMPVEVKTVITVVFTLPEHEKGKEKHG